MDNQSVMKLNLLTLKFSGEWSNLEVPFQSNYFRASLPHNRAALIVGVLFYSAFGILDMLLMPENKSTTWLIRFAIVNPVLIGIFLLSFFKSFEHFINPLISCASILAGGGIICMVVVAPAPVNYSYYAGLLLVFMWSYTFVRIPFLWASMSGWVLVILYQIAAIWISPTPFAVLLNNNFFFISANIMGMIACYSLEYYARRDFFLTRQVDMEREKINRVKQELEGQTAEYQIVNRTLEQEVAARRQVEEVLRESEEKYRSVVERSLVGIAIIDDAFQYTYANEEFCKMAGREKQEIIGKNFTSLLDEESKLLAAEVNRRRQIGEDVPSQYEFLFVQKNGEKRTGEVRSSLYIDSSGKTKIIIQVIDITERKHVEEALRESEEMHTKLVATMPDIVVRTNLQGEIRFVNDVGLHLSNYQLDELIGQNMLSFIAPEDKERIIQNTFLMFERNLGPQEYHLIMKDGRKLLFEVNGDVLRNEDGSPYGMVQICRDITERKRTEEVLRESEEKYRLIAENTADVIAVMDLNLRLTFISPSIQRSLGYTVEEFMNMSLDRIITPRSLENMLAVFDEEMKLEATGSADPGRMRIVEIEEYKKDGSVVWRESSISIQRDRENKPIGVITVNRDITLRKKAEEALRESEDKFRKLTEASNVGITITDGQRFLYVNPATCKMSGFSEEEYLSRPMIEFVTPDSRELIYQRAMDRLAGKPVPDRYEISVLSKESGVKWAEVGATVIEYHGKPATIFTMLDITDRKKAEAEKESLQAQLLRAQKMEALGQLAGGVAHDLNNVLGILSGYSELLLMEIPEGQRARGHVEKIFQSTEKGAAIIQDLLTLARRGVTVADVINLNNVVADFLATPVFDKIKDFHPRV
ncbi:MAG: hypothetical protein CVU52_03540, partial [Deltaproteobacteria bacterium HGW-Deltaproteobacteria-10]